MLNWNRQYRMRAKLNGETKFEIGEPDETTHLALHIHFSVEKTDSTTLNSTKIKLWNLSPESVNVLLQTGCAVEINAGYGESMPLIFRGVVSNVEESIDGADRLIELEAVDGFASISKTKVSISYKGKTMALTVLLFVAEKMGLPIVYSKSARAVLENSYFYNGYSYIGYASYALDKICSITGLSWSIQNGILQMRKKGEGVSRSVHLINKETGLINIPKRIYSSSVSSTDTETDTASDSLYGYEIEYFLNGAIGIGDTVYVESGIVTGYFMVYEITMDGDNLEGDWTCTAKITEAKSGEE